MYGLDYLFYTFFMGAFLVIVLLVLVVLRKWNVLKKTVLVALPLLLVIQVYYWNRDINFFVKSFAFPAKEYECTSYDYDEINLRFSLPKRTVYHNKEDQCSPFYGTYASEEEFYTFFQSELDGLAKAGLVHDYERVVLDRWNDPDHIWEGYEATLITGKKLFITYKEGIISINIIITETEQL